ncbi:hypothetical protein Cgig2_026677 [Carnegiea gigantea]|uniref:Uncharacterized protein n=1 Tax=Carnegiea gigantea TaxID=171969 RepID=A0A9Q1JYY1_9CARY|nr:hypothetical protein Cgig2_026677 [Carnegiea gigantea]
MSLDKFLFAKNISAERVLEIEYIKAVVPRKQEEPSVHDDWVSAIDGCNTGVWKDSTMCTHLLQGHAGPLTSICAINAKSSEGANNIHVATASKDRTLRLWEFDAEDTLDGPARTSAFKVLRGHSAAVQCVSSQPSGNMFCGKVLNSIDVGGENSALIAAGASDATLRIWDPRRPGAMCGLVERLTVYLCPRCEAGVSHHADVP